MSATSRLSRIAGLAVGFVAGRLIDHPARRRPVAAFEQATIAVEDRTYADDANWGTVHTAAVVGGVAALGLVVERLTRKRPVLHTIATAAATVVVLDREAGADDSPLDRTEIGTMLWGGALGIPGLLGYRAARLVADRLDPKEEKYANFGRSAAQLGSFVDYVPARIAASLTSPR